MYCYSNAAGDFEPDYPEVFDAMPLCHREDDDEFYKHPYDKNMPAGGNFYNQEWVSSK